MLNFCNLVEIVRSHSCERSCAIAYRFLVGSEQRAVDLSFGDLDLRARAIAAYLQEQGVGAHDRVLVMYPAGLDYVCGLVGCFYAGAIAVPVYPPSPMGLSRARERIANVVADAGSQVVLGCRSDNETGTVVSELSGCRLLDISDVDPSMADGWIQPEIRAEDACILQYTSGSTSAPKGVLISHGNLIANHAQMHEAMGNSSADTVVSWLPPYHDMGLIGGIFTTLFLGVTSIQLTPDAFLRKPERWFEAVTRYKGTIIVGPNFALDLCVRRGVVERVKGLDLSSVRVCCCGAEPINPDTIERFLDVFEPYGFDPAAIMASYGLAEATLLVTGGERFARNSVRTFCADSLDRGSAVPVDVGDNTRRLVSCGHPATGNDLCIVDPQRCTRLSDQQIGEIWVRGPSIALGYFNNSAASTETFSGKLAGEDASSYLRTGDLGFMHEGQLFVAGRLKEMIVVRGRNLFPHDVERLVQELSPALVEGSGAAFGVLDDEGEQLVVVQEFDKRANVELDGLLHSVPVAVQTAFGVSPVEVVFIKRGSLLKTSSGKVQRNAMRTAWHDGGLQVCGRWQRPARSEHQALADRSTHSRSTLLPPPMSQTRELQQLDVHKGEDEVRRYLLKAVAAKVEVSSDDIDPDVSLAQFGADSLMLTELVEELEQWLGRALPTTIVYENPTINALSSAIAGLSGTGSAQSRSHISPTSMEPANVPSQSAEEIAVVGMACRFPGATNLDAYWQLMQNQVDAISGVPEDRWNAQALYAPEPRTRGHICNQVGGFLPDMAEFDHEFFGISRREAERMDPQQRVFLEVAWEALEHAGIDPFSLKGTDTGVFVGASNHDYAILYGGDLELLDGDSAPGSSTGVIGSRLSYFLDLRGPSLSFDAACASSLVALEAACSALARGDCQIAIVGGVNAVLAPETSVCLSQAGMLSAQGRCRAFDSEADGFVRSEGVGAIVLTSHAIARSKSLHVRALLAGAAINHGGQTAGIIAPSGQAQQRVMERAWQRANVGCNDVDYIEAHGVGSPVADAVELSSIIAMLAERGRRQPCFLGSVKTNIGHLESAAGIAAVIKTILALEHEEIPANLHLRSPLPQADEPASNVVIPTVATPWPRGRQPRVAGVSAFGFGGTNAHVVIRDAPQVLPKKATHHREVQLVLLSARTEVQLSSAARRLSRTRSKVALGDVCHTLAVGRAHHRHRRSYLVGNGEGWKDALRDIAGEDASIAQLYRVPEQESDVVRPAFWEGVASPAKPPIVALRFGDDSPQPSQLLEVVSMHPVTRAVFEEVSALAADFGIADFQADVSAGRELNGSQNEKIRTLACFAAHWAIFELLETIAIVPRVISGTGVGELSAACAAGSLDWQEGLRLAVKREEVLAKRSAGQDSSDAQREFERACASLSLSTPEGGLVSNGMAQAAEPERLRVGALFVDAQMVGSNDSAACMEELEVDVQLVAFEHGQTREGETSIPLLRHDCDIWSTFFAAVGQLYVAGVTPRLAELNAPFGYQLCELPTYPFAQTRCWLEFPERQYATLEERSTSAQVSHPLLRASREVVRRRSGFVIREATAEDADALIKRRDVS